MYVTPLGTLNPVDSTIMAIEGGQHAPLGDTDASIMHRGDVGDTGRRRLRRHRKNGSSGSQERAQGQKKQGREGGTRHGG